MSDPAKVERVQCNVRLPKDLIQAMDERRAKKDLSRDKWVERAIRFALSQQPAPRPGTRPTTR